MTQQFRRESLPDMLERLRLLAGEGFPSVFKHPPTTRNIVDQVVCKSPNPHYNLSQVRRVAYIRRKEQGHQFVFMAIMLEIPEPGT